MLGKTILHYKIIEKLGEGGMGVVYKAEDTKLERIVAIKFLPGHIASNEEEHKRFEIEAKAAAALNHPNIATIHAIEETDEQIFIVMEYIEGMELRQIVGAHRDAPMSMAQIIDHATQIASGLQAAHEKDVIHRDIKSANIMITEKGQVKIMDFGLAKVRGNALVTKAGTTLGTAAYMSPEQTRGEEVDHRTDIWSFGVVLYEMLTGALPFKGDYEQAVVYSILNEAPKSLSEINSETPEFIHELITKCLRKDPAERYQAASELLTGLTGGVSTKGSGRSYRPKQVRPLVTVVILSLLLVFAAASYFLFFKPDDIKERVPMAVVDFVNETNEPELDGLSGMLITALEQSRRLDVMSRARMYDEFQQMEQANLHFVDETTGREIAKRANLSALAAATIRKFGQLYTVDFKVIDPQTGDRLFSTKVEGKGQESIPGLLDQLSDKTRIDLIDHDRGGPLDRRGVAEITTANLEAYQHYFKGEEYIDKRAFEHAKEEFRKAIAIDSTFALAYYRLSYAMGWNSEQLAAEPLKKALRLIDRIPVKERYRLRAEEARLKGGFTAGVTALKEMEKHYPQDKEMLFNIADLSYHGGDLETALVYFKKVLALEPGHKRARDHYRRALLDSYTNVDYIQGDFSSALSRAIKDREKQPDVPELTAAIATLYTYQGDYQRAENELTRYLERTTALKEVLQARFGLACLLPYTGQYQRTLQLLDANIEEAFARFDTATAVTTLISKGMISSEGMGNLAAANMILDRVLAFRDRSDVPNLKSALALFAIFCNRQDWTSELLEETQNPFAIVTSLSRTGQCDEAESIVEAMKEQPGLPGFAKIWMFYHMAECRFEEGNPADALPYAEATIEQHDPLNFFTRGVFHPKALLLLGKINEANGSVGEAMKYYRQLLDLWKNADEDLPDLLAARQRYEQLKESTSQ